MSNLIYLGMFFGIGYEAVTLDVYFDFNLIDFDSNHRPSPLG